MSFNDYSLSELYDIRNHIDREKHPEKFLLIESRIEELKGTVQFTNKEFTILSDRMARWTGIAQILTGTFILFGFTYFSLFSTSSFQGNIFAPIVAVLCACSLLVAGGVYLFKSQKKGGWISAAGILFFTISFQVSSIMYSMIPGFALNVGISSIQGLFFSFEFGELILNVGSNPEDEFRVGFNIIALMYLLIVISYKTYFKYPENYIEV